MKETAYEVLHVWASPRLSVPMLCLVRLGRGFTFTGTNETPYSVCMGISTTVHCEESSLLYVECFTKRQKEQQ
jgi:hypothetical protein